MGTIAVVESSDDVAGLSVGDALSVPLVIADSTVPDVIDDAEVSEVLVLDADSGVVVASEAPEVEVAASDAPEVVVVESEAPEEVADASDSPEVADALSSVEVAVALSVGEDAAPDVASPDPVVFVTLSSAGVEIGTGTMGTMVLSVAVSVELFEETDDGLSVGKSVVCSAAVAVDDTSLAVAEAELPVPTELSVALVVTGTGIAVVPSVPVDVLRL